MSSDFVAKEPVDKEKLPQEYQMTLKKLENRHIQPDNLEKNTLLTGATGFLGAHLLLELLQTTNATIFTLVRGKSDQNAKERLIEICEFYFAMDIFAHYSDRIVICKGDISELELGLTHEKYLDLSQKMDIIINVASNVKHYGTYEDFYQSNVLGVKYLIEFQELGKQKQLVQCSTVSLGSGYLENVDHFDYTEDVSLLPVEHESVYLKTKAEAEELLFEARSRGLSNSIIRLGNLQSNTETGKFQINDSDNAFFSQIKGLLHLGIAPDIDYKVEYTPINLAARACVKLITLSSATNEIYHVYNPHPVLMKKLIQSFASESEFEFVSLETFYQILFEQLQKEKVDEEILLLSLHLGLFKEPKLQTAFTIHSEKTNAILKKLDFEWEELDEDALLKIGNQSSYINKKESD